MTVKDTLKNEILKMNKIKQIRESKGMTHQDVIIKANTNGEKITNATLSRIENGKGNPNLRTLKAIANALEVSIHDLI